MTWSDTRHSVQKKYISFCREMQHGMPQRSILGPIIFITCTSVTSVKHSGGRKFSLQMIETCWLPTKKKFYCRRYKHIGYQQKMKCPQT